MGDWVGVTDIVPRINGGKGTLKVIQVILCCSATGRLGCGDEIIIAASSE